MTRLLFNIALMLVCLLLNSSLAVSKRSPVGLAFVSIGKNKRTASSQLMVAHRGAYGRHAESYHRKQERSKRQERVGQLVMSELSSIIHRGTIKGDAEYLDDDLRRRISVVKADVSPDLKQARISVSIRGAKGQAPKVTGEEAALTAESSAFEKRRAYAWLVRNTKPIRHSLARKMSHMKTCPNLSFVQVDVAAATDVMYLIDKVTAGYKRDTISYTDDSLPSGMVDGIDFDEDLSEEDWQEEDDDFF